MTVLSDSEIIKLGNRGAIAPFDEEIGKQDSLIQPASLDIKIGHTAKRLLTDCDAGYDSYEIRFEDIDLTEYSQEKPYRFMPNERLLVASLETFNIPKDVCGQVVLRSSAARSFIQHLHAGWIDPGWNGSKLTMELINWSYTPFNLYSGRSIAQIVFYRLKNTPLSLYEGKYNGDESVSASK